jgi:hypothetical protein
LLPAAGGARGALAGAGLGAGAGAAACDAGRATTGAKIAATAIAISTAATNKAG